LLWAARGLQRLYERGHFIQPSAGGELLGELEDLASPVGAFVRDCCEVGNGYEVLVQDIFSRWQRWCEQKGRREPGTEQTFGRDLHAAVSSLHVRQPREGGGRVRVYEGIKLLP